MSGRQVAAFVLAFAVAAYGREASACSPAIPVPAPTDPAKVSLDSTPPVIFDVTIADIIPGDPDPTSSCWGFGRLLLNVEAEDDQTPRGALRYRVLDGKTGGPLYGFDEPLPWFEVFWNDDGTTGPDVRIRVFVLDEAGNQSAPFDFSTRAASDGEGCNMSGTGAPAPVWWPFVALAWFGRRARRTPFKRT